MILPILIILVACLSVLAPILQSYYYVVGYRRGSLRNDNTFHEDSSRKVSIHIPVKNEPKDIVRRALLSIRGSNYNGEMEVLVISDDDPATCRELKEFSKDVLEEINGSLICRGRPYGRKAGALNCALRKTKGDYVIVLDADARVSENFINTIISFSNKTGHPHISLWKAYNAEESLISEALAIAEEFANASIILGREMVMGRVSLVGSGCCIEKRLLERVGGWDESVLLEDVELGLRLESLGRPVKTCPHNLLVEMPATYSAFKAQQCRWAYGAVELLKRILLGKYSLSLRSRIEWTIYLSQYFSSLFSFILLPLATIAMLIGGVMEDLSMQTAIMLMLAPSILYAILFVNHAVRYCGKRLLRALRIIGRLSCVTLSMSPSITYSVIKSFLSLPFEWRITPKGPRKPKMSGLQILELFILAVLLVLLSLSITLGKIVYALWFALNIPAYSYVVINSLTEKI